MYFMYTPCWKSGISIRTSDNDYCLFFDELWVDDSDPNNDSYNGYEYKVSSYRVSCVRKNKGYAKLYNEDEAGYVNDIGSFRSKEISKDIANRIWKSVKKSGMSAKDVALNLKEMGLIEKSEYFKIAA